MTSLLRRLQAGLGFAMVAVIGTLVLVGGEAVRHVGEDLVASRLQHDADSLLAALQISADGQMQVNEPQLGAIYDRPFTGHYYVIAPLDGRASLRSRSLWDAPLAVPPLPPGERHRWNATGPDDQPLLVWAGGFRKQEHDVTIAVAEELGPLHQHLTIVRGILGAIGLVVLLGVLGLQQIVLRRGFEPLRETAADVERLATGEIATLDESVPVEIQPLVHEINRLLVLLDRRLQRSRNAAGNLAHALKSPLALLQQLAHSPELEGHAQVATELAERVTQIQKTIDSELKRARLAGRSGKAMAFRPTDDLQQLVEVLQRIFATRELVIDVECPDDVTLPLDRDDALELIGNLMDNACKWAQQHVRLTLEKPRQGCLVVEDDGPGCTQDRITELSQRGKRLDESVAGHGLGLAIVHEIAELYGASLKFGQSPSLGGMQVTICFKQALTVSNDTDSHAASISNAPHSR